MNKNILKIVFIVVLGVFVYVGCAKDDEKTGTSSEGYGADNSRDVMTQLCLGCHEGNYQSFAASTAHLGEDYWLNPHRSAHGTNIPCMTCHDANTTGDVATKCSMSTGIVTVMVADTCAAYCHDSHADQPTNPYSNLNLN